MIAAGAGGIASGEDRGEGTIRHRAPRQWRDLGAVGKEGVVGKPDHGGIWAPRGTRGRALSALSRPHGDGKADEAGRDLGDAVI